MIAVYSCWKGHATKINYPTRESIPPDHACEKCLEIAPLGTVLGVDEGKGESTTNLVAFPGVQLPTN